MIAERPDAPTARLMSLDAYRGLVMFLMLAEVLHLSLVAREAKSPFWDFLAYHQSHVEWTGCSLHDLIQPSFTFLVGAALPFSIASRRRRGQSTLRMTVHAFWRALVLVCLGIFLRSVGSSRTNFTFEDTLTQIGLGYGFLFMIGLRPVREQMIALVLVLVGSWALFAAYPLPPADFDWAAVGVPSNWPHHPTGFAAHWDKNSNAAWAFDTWFLNLFPRDRAFVANRGGYATLSFLPTLATMILGLYAGGVLRSDRSARKKLAHVGIASGVTFASGLALHALGAVPIVKRIWTPSWVLFSGGWCFLLTACFYAVVDVLQFQRWSFPLVVIGMNSIAAYCMDKFFVAFISSALKRHFGQEPFQALGPVYEPLLLGSAVLLALWLILYWMYRRGLFLRI